MTIYIVTRHCASREWILNNLPHSTDETIVQSHLDPNVIQQGDVVVGVLPLHIIAQIYDKGGTFYAFDIVIDKNLRGKELSKKDLVQCQPTLTKYTVIQEKIYE